MARIITLEEMLKRLKETHGDDISYVSGFKGMNVKCMWKCNKCGKTWFAIPSNVVGHNKSGCPTCSKRNHKHKKKETAITTEAQLILKLKEIHGNAFYYISGFTKKREKALFFCTKCGKTFRTRCQTILTKGYGCPLCTNRKNVTEEVMLQDLKNSGRTDLIYVGGYTKMSKKCKWKCTICGHEWEAVPNSIFSGGGCPICAIQRQIMPLNEMLLKVALVNPNIEYVEGYVSCNKKCKWRCKLDGNEWEATPEHIFGGRGCPVCGLRNIREKQRIPLETIIELINTVSNHTIEYVEGYVNSGTPCKWRCKVCGCEWVTCPSNIINNGTRCPTCVKYSMEKPVLEYLKNKGINPIYNTGLKGCYFNGNKVPLKPDFIIETHKGNLVIELDGKQHFYPIYGKDELKLIQERDKYKDKYLKEHGYIEIRITSSPTKEWGTEKHLTMEHLYTLFNTGISDNGEIDLEVFRPYDFNREEA